MITELKTDITIKELCEGFVYNEIEEKGLFGLSGKLVIQPAYQRNYIYAEGKKDVDVIESLLKGFPIGLFYFNKIDDDHFEVMDGQQRITSIGRYLTGKFPIFQNGVPRYFTGLPSDQRDKILNTKMTIWFCSGTETEITDWFRTINIAGVALNDQEIANAIYCGPFVTLAKEIFSNSQNANIQKWSAYIKGNVKRQDFLRAALQWVSKGDIDGYMSYHRQDTNINELTAYFNSVIDWASSIFTDVEPEMKGLPWGEYYEKYHNNSYSPADIHIKVQKLYSDYFVKNRKGVFEYILSGCTDTKLLEVRLFDEPTKKSTYEIQTSVARSQNISNCPLCAASGQDGLMQRLYKYAEMDADHVTAWSNGGATNPANCQMLCKTHNRSKGNR